MNENITYIAKLSARSALSFLKINGLIAFTTALVMVVGLFVLSNGVDSGNSGHVSSAPFMILLFLYRPIGTVLWGMAITVAPITLFAMGNKYIIAKAAAQVVKNKSQSLLDPILDKALAKLQAAPPAVQKGGSVALSKLQLIQNIKEDKTANKWLRRIVVMGLKKVRLNDIDLSQNNAKFSQFMKERALDQLHNLVAPSRRGILLILLFQWVVLVVLWFTEI